MRHSRRGLLPSPFSPITVQFGATTQLPLPNTPLFSISPCGAFAMRPLRGSSRGEIPPLFTSLSCPGAHIAIVTRTVNERQRGKERARARLREGADAVNGIFKTAFSLSLSLSLSLSIRSRGSFPDNSLAPIPLGGGGRRARDVASIAPLSRFDAADTRGGYIYIYVGD